MTGEWLANLSADRSFPFAEVEAAAGAFEPIGLESTSDEVAEDRIDTKYLFRVDLLPDILASLTDDYRILEVEGKRLSRYRTIYFDTPDLHFYHSHRTERLPRRKMRLRDYIETGTSYLEIKETNNRGRTVKLRIRVSTELGERSRWPEEAELPVPVDFDSLAPVLTVTYTRITLVRTDPAERVTFDMRLSATREERTRWYPRAVIGEVKQPRLRRTPVVRAFRDRNVRQLKLSKYCLNLATLEPELRQNCFKEGVRRLASHESFFG